jgi:hypothetical protein
MNMKNTISLELSKKLNEEWLLDDIETEYRYDVDITNWEMIRLSKNNSVINSMYEEWFKTLTLEEAIEFIWKNMCQMKLLYPNAWKWIMDLQFAEDNIKWNSLIEVFEQFIEYLLTEKLLWKES